MKRLNQEWISPFLIWPFSFLFYFRKLCHDIKLFGKNNRYLYVRRFTKRKEETSDRQRTNPESS